MDKHFFKINKELKESQRRKKALIDEEGRTIISISVLKDDDFLSYYSINEQPIITTEVADCLENSVKHLKPKTKLHFIFKSNEIDENEEIAYEKAINNYYTSEFIELCNDMRSHLFLSLIMTFVGAFFFALSLIVEKNSDNQILFNIIDIIAWVFVWEAVDIFFLERAKLKYKRQRCFEIMNSKISFHKIDEK